MGTTTTKQPSAPRQAGSEALQLLALIEQHGDLLKGPEAARRLGVSRQRVAQLGKRGDIRNFKVGPNLYYPLSDLQAWETLRTLGELYCGRRNPQPVYVPRAVL